MKTSTLFTLLLLSLNTPSLAAEACPATLDHQRKLLASEQQQNLCKQYLGNVVLIVNTASKCGYTYQYEGLEELYKKNKSRGLVVLGFPSNDFANQEPGNEQQIQDFCRLTYDVKFPMFSKTHVAKGTQDPLYNTLAEQAGEYPKWNFHKYLLDRNGKLVGSYNSKVEPQSEELIRAIEEQLKK